MRWRSDVAVAVAVMLTAGVARADDLPAPYQMPALDAPTSVAASVLGTASGPVYEDTPPILSVVLAPRLTWRLRRRLTAEVGLPVVLESALFRDLNLMPVSLGNLTVGVRHTTGHLGNGITVGGGASLALAIAGGEGTQRVAARFPAEVASLWPHAHVLRAHGDAAWHDGILALQAQLGFDHFVRLDGPRDQTLLRLGLAASVRIGAPVTLLTEITLFTDVLDEEWDEGYDVAIQVDAGFRWRAGRWTIGAHAAVPLMPDTHFGAAMDLTRSL